MDYRYFSDPDLPIVIISDERIEDMQNEMPEFAAKKVERFINEYKLNENEAITLASEMELAECLWKAVVKNLMTKLLNNWSC